MKFKLLITLLSLGSICLAQVDSYFIADTNFRAFFQNQLPEVLENDSTLNISACATVTQIDCASSDISDLDGISYFINLDSLNCSYNQLTELVDLPNNLSYLNCSYCVNLDSLGPLPSNLNYLDCSYNHISDLPMLPMGLKKLFCSVNYISSIDYLPQNLTHLDCSFNNLSELPYLPSELIHINCSYNQLISLPDLPIDLGLTYNNPLNIFNNEITCVGSYSEVFEELLGLYPTCTDSTPTFAQEVSFPEGWSIFSVYGNSSTMDLESILAPISDQVIIAKNNEGSVYLSEANYNGVGNINIGEGYQIKMNAPASLTLNLETIQPEANSITLYQGWNLVGYIRNSPAAADLVLQELVNQGKLLIAKDYSGAIYIPSWGYNGIGDLLPGMGYQIKVTENTQLHFLPNELEY